MNWVLGEGGYRRPVMRYDERCKLQRELLDRAAEQLVAACAKVDGVYEVYAYGSYARGNVGANSDLDALIIRDTDLPRMQREDDIRLQLRAPVGFDLLVVRPDEYREQMPANSVGRSILSEAKLLHRFRAIE